MPGRRTSVRTRLLATVTMALLAVGAGFSAPAVAPVAAAQCRSGGHVTYLEGGAVSPTSGTAGTLFTFTVVFRDNLDRAPYSISAIVDGTPYPMSGPASGFAQGVTFATSMPTGADTHYFSFTATARRSNGSAGCTVNLAGGTLSVVAPTPTPTPTPTPPPPPPPTPAPTPKPTAKATPRPTPTPTPKPPATATPRPNPPTATPAAPLSPSPLAEPSTSPVVTGSPSPASTPTPDPLTAGGAGIGGRGGGGGGGVPTSGSSGLPGGDDGLPFPLTIALASMTLAGLGLLLLMLMLGRRRRDDEPELALATVASAPPESAPLDWAPAAAAPAWAVAGDVLPTEAGVPRWRRQSLRETRRRSERDAPVARAPLAFRTPAEPGVERRLVAYSLVRLSSEPDELLGEELGWLDRGDEVEVVQTRGVHWLVRTPDGAVGWIHRTTLESTPLGDGGLGQDEPPAGEALLD